ncbi:helix-turn-helix domain-containing protein [Lelliottia sp. V89_10]|uniref:winged helix-turn-helix transcriptional regulator n=1 Tax=Lelliottia wanjuensis TaxID=3050585 RepID=UPI00249F0596|nr:MULTISPECIES: winged helix-turn-helix transcriptional regulator [unclassified Lelliottia]MDI3359183.1 helix-turn-helix domain-containing protein [Lelliottia sp. V89_13]MDK9550876.1 helix-turn-helix domain-containing protein [Lelliottia sp. V89_5]MDK9598365.1 helix-turn-helix domain-containing protein [Lelliottia sp. V89_10]
MSHTDKPSFPMNRASPVTGKLIDILLPYSTAQAYPPGQKLPLRIEGIPTCYILLDGTTEFHRGLDGLVVTRIYAPAIAGLADVQFATFRDSWIETREMCQIATITLDQAYDIIRQNDLMETLVGHINGIFGKLYYYNLLNTAPSAYEIIRYQLMELMTESEAFRASTTVEKYIRTKTHLSRSGILKILAELKTGGYVEMDEGRLVKINKLPAKY